MTKFTEDHKRKISDALKRGSSFRCWTCQNEFWRKPSAIKRGDNKFCSRDCYFKWQKGKRKIVNNPCDKKGANGSNWKGGLTAQGVIIRNSKEMDEWRKKVFERDNWTCRKCGDRSKANHYVRIEAHHIKPFAKFPELRFVVDNGMTLCKKCHSKEPKGKDVWHIN